MRGEYLTTVLEVNGLYVGTHADGGTFYFWEPSRLSSEELEDTLATLGYERSAYCERLEDTLKLVYVGTLAACPPGGPLWSAAASAAYLGELAPDFQSERLDEFAALDWQPPAV